MVAKELLFLLQRQETTGVCSWTRLCGRSQDGSWIGGGRWCSAGM